MKRPRESQDDAPGDPEASGRRDEIYKDILMPDTSEMRSNGSMSDDDDPILQSNHKIFLSHSGAQKDFVEQLCRDLENRYHFPFFDRRPSSLPKGERFPELILNAARQCQMAVVVVSEEYFSSKWPMIELHAFVQARLRSNPKLKILPLFYKLSVHEFCNERRRDQWFSIWEDWAKSDSRINIDEWKDSLKMLASFNGIEYNPDSSGVEAYREFIVSNICKEVPSDIKWDDSYVQGRSTLCQEICHRIQQVPPSRQNGVHLIGYYGVGGIGKTTMCKTLCNALSQEFKGKVSQIEFGSQSYEELLKKVLKDLTNLNGEFLQQLNDGECRNILRTGMYKQKTFLALDNVWLDSKSIGEVKEYIQAHFHESSVVMVTCHSLETLTYLGINRSHCFELPSLGHEDAKNLFLHHAAHGIQFSNNDDKWAIERCIACCYSGKGAKKGHHYLPLALKALGVQLGCIGNSPSEWVKVLPKVKDFNYLEEEPNPVFGILRSSFDQLRPIDQSLFMDLVLYRPMQNDLNHISMEWLSLVHNQDLQVIKDRVQQLKARGLLEDLDMTSQRVYVHDLYREFARLESKGNLNEPAAFEKQKWVYYENAYPTELEMTPSNRCWQNLIRIAILDDYSIGLTARTLPVNLRSMQRMDWRNFSNVVVLKLDWLFKLEGELDLKGLKCLRSLELDRIGALDSLDGLQDLNNLKYFRWTLWDYTVVHTRMGQLPASLIVLELDIRILLRSDVFAYCTKLSKLMLNKCRAESLDFSKCKSLQSVMLTNLKLLNTNLPGLSAAATSSLQFLLIKDADDLVGIEGLGQLAGLQHLHLRGNHKFWTLPNLEKLTRLQVLNLKESMFVEVPGLGSLQQLRELTWTGIHRLLVSTTIKLPNLSGLTQLQAIDFSKNIALTSLEGVFWDLPALRRLNFSECCGLRWLPDLRRSKKLEELVLFNSGIALGEDDVCMLAALPLLQPVRVGKSYPNLRLDVVRRKVLKKVGTSGDSWLEWTKWEESDLGMLPIYVDRVDI